MTEVRYEKSEWGVGAFHSQEPRRKKSRNQAGFELCQHRTTDYKLGIDRADMPTEFVGRGELYDQAVQGSLSRMLHKELPTR